jgi:hypothetical protein
MTVDAVGVGGGCPRWCRQLPGHLHLRDNGGDFHTALVAAIDLPAIDGLRGEAAVHLTLSQYVTGRTAGEPVIALDLSGEEDGGMDGLTIAEARSIADALYRAIAMLRGAWSSEDADVRA